MSTNSVSTTLQSSETRPLPEPIKIEATSAKASYRFDKGAGRWIIYDEGTPEGFLDATSLKDAGKIARHANRGGGFYGWTPPFVAKSVQPLINKLQKDHS